MNIERRDFAISDLEIRADASAEGQTLSGYAAVFDTPSRDLGGFVEYIRHGAFKRSLGEAQSGNPDHNIFALWSHRSDLPLGSIKGGKLRLTEDERGLRFDLDTSRFTPAQLDAARDGELRMSFGFSVREQSWTTAEGHDERSLIDLDLYEVSPVINPAYPDTSAALRQHRDWLSAQTETIEHPVELTTDEVRQIELLKRLADQKIELTRL